MSYYDKDEEDFIYYFFCGLGLLLVILAIICPILALLNIGFGQVINKFLNI